MEKVIFLDRDGTLNEEVNYLHRKEDLRILPGVMEAVKAFRDRGFKIVVVTNQAGVARGYYNEETVDELHRYMNEQFQAQGAGIDAFFFCPHHPEHGIGEYKKVCHCRKPETGMFEMAERLFAVDKAASWMIGDKLIDVQAGRNYGVRTVLVGTGYGAEERRKAESAVYCAGDSVEGTAESAACPGKTRAAADLPYDFYAETLMDAARMILGE